MEYKQITRARYVDLRWILPVLFIDTVDSYPIHMGFAVCEAHDYNEHGVELTICFRRRGRYYEAIANIRNRHGYVTDYVGRSGTYGNHADTQFRKTRLPQ